MFSPAIPKHSLLTCSVFHAETLKQFSALIAEPPTLLDCNDAFARMVVALSYLAAMVANNSLSFIWLCGGLLICVIQAHQLRQTHTSFDSVT